MLKIIRNNGKIPDSHMSRLFKLNYVEMAKITNYNNAFIWTDKIIGCIKSSFKDDSHKDITQAAYKVLTSWTVMEATPNQNKTRFGCKTEHNIQNNDNGNDEQSDEDNGGYCDDDNENDINSAENSFLFTEFDSSNDLLTKLFEKSLLNAKVQICSFKMEYKSLKDHVKENYKTKNIDYIAI